MLAKAFRFIIAGFSKSSLFSYAIPFHYSFRPIYPRFAIHHFRIATRDVLVCLAFNMAGIYPAISSKRTDFLPYSAVRRLIGSDYIRQVFT